MAYALKLDGKVIPLTGMIDPKLLLHGEGNTIMYEQNALAPRRAVQALLDRRLARVIGGVAQAASVLPAADRRLRRR